MKSVVSLVLVLHIVQERVPARIIPRNGPEPLKRAYLKYGDALPKHLERRGQQGIVAHQPYFYGDGYPDDKYLSAIHIGTPPQKLSVDLDTGSADLWVYSSDTPLDDGRNNHSYYNAPKSATSKKLKGYTYNITYGDGSTSNGDLQTDVVKYAGVTFPSQAVEAMEYLSPEYLVDLNFDGYFRLGHDDVQPVPQSSFTNVTPSLAEPLLTLSLNHLIPGVNDSGFVDPKKSSEQVQYFPSLLPPPGHGRWVINSTGYSVGNAKTFTPFVGGLHAIIDSGFHITPSVVDDPDYGYVLSCKDTLPDLTLAIGSYQAKIPGLLFKGANINSTSKLDLTNAMPSWRDSLPIGPDSPQAVYGDAFLKTTFTVFKHPPGGSPRLGFAGKSIPSSYGD
ncbi:Type I transmembrane sorting receptor [Xylographa trunciseda]|nr:Type I transmembrane sorting receptor [Xylographa trunciseda]